MIGQTFIFFGIVGSGKGTQVKLLMDVLKKQDSKDIIYAYPGEEYRTMIASGNQTGQIVSAAYNRGELQPDFLTISIVNHILMSSITESKHVIADGYPRTVVQSEAFETIMKYYGRTDIKIIYIELGKEEAMKRNLLRGRSDDTKEGIAKRFDEYMNNVIPAMNYFKDKKDYTFFSINGEQSVEAVHKDILRALGY
jgi:adenylate kinase